jgi:hypothetical protein
VAQLAEPALALHGGIVPVQALPHAQPAADEQAADDV